jgi:hypothetical protein
MATAGPKTRDRGLPARQRVTDPSDHAIPLAFLDRRVIDQHAIHETACKVATVVPNLVVSKAGHHKKTRCDPLVNNIRRRVFLR